MVSPKVLSSPKLARPTLPGSSKSNLKDFVIGDEKEKSSASKSATIQKPNSSTTIENSASKEIVAMSEQPKSITAPANPPK